MQPRAGANQVTIELKGLAATIEVDTTPTGATVEADGKPLGNTPLDITTLPPEARQ